LLSCGREVGTVYDRQTQVVFSVFSPLSGSIDAGYGTAATWALWKREVTVSDRPGQDKMLEEISLRNRIAEFQDLNRRAWGVAAIPRVGIFWVGSDGTVHAESTSLRDAVDYGDFKTHDGAHYEAWSRAIGRNPSWQAYEYEEVPRGRVVYRRHPKRPRFIVYMPEQLSPHCSKIEEEFKLPSKFTRFDFSDEHYSI